MNYTINGLVTLLDIKRRMVRKFYQIYPMTKKEKSEKADTFLPTKFKVLMLFKKSCNSNSNILETITFVVIF